MYMLYIVEYCIPTIQDKYSIKSMVDKVCIKRFISILYDLYWNITKPQLTPDTANINNKKINYRKESYLVFDLSNYLRLKDTII